MILDEKVFIPDGRIDFTDFGGAFFHQPAVF